MVASNNGRKANISVALVAILITSTFAGLTFGVDGAHAASFSNGPQASHSEVRTAGTDVTITFTVELEAGEAEAKIQDCTFKWNDNPISASPSGSECADKTIGGVGGSTSEQFTYVWDVPAATPTEESGIEVTVSWESGTPSAPTELSDTTDLVMVDLHPPVAEDAVAISDGATTLGEENLDGSSLLGSASSYTISFTNPDNRNDDTGGDGFLATATALRCGPDADEEINSRPWTKAENPSSSTISATPGQLGLSGSSDSHSVAFYLQYEDHIGHSSESGADGQDDTTDGDSNFVDPTDPSTCFQFIIDNHEPEISLTSSGRDKLPTANGAAATSGIELTQGTDFTVTEQNLKQVQISADSESDTASGNDDTVMLQVKTPTEPEGLTPGLHDVILQATDDVSLTGTTTRSNVRVDGLPPTLERVVVQDQNGACSPKVWSSSPTGQELSFGADGGEYCTGPYDVTVEIMERFPDGGASDPNDPAVTPTNLAFGDAQWQGSNAGGDQPLHTWTYSGVDVQDPNQAVSFQFNLEESHNTRGLDEKDTVFSFTFANLPQATFEPRETRFEDEDQEFRIAFTGTDCSGLNVPGGADGAFCAPGSGSTTVRLVSEDGSTTIPITPDDGTWDQGDVGTGTWTVADGNAEVERMLLEVDRGGRLGKSAATTMVMDRADPQFTGVTVYEWGVNQDAPEKAWLPRAANGETSVADIPSDGHYLVEVDYESYSLKRIDFRFVDKSDRDESSETQQKYLEYQFEVEPTGDFAGVTHKLVGPAQQSVHLARNVAFFDGTTTTTTPASGCTGSDSTPLWGASRTCYFLIETGSPTLSRDGTDVQTPPDFDIGNNKDWIVQPVIVEESGTDKDPLTALPVVTSNDPDTKVDEILLSPETIEIGSSTTLSIELNARSGNSDAQTEAIDTWICVLRPGDDGVPDPSSDLPFGGYAAFRGGSAAPDCDPAEFPFPERDNLPPHEVVHARQVHNVDIPSGETNPAPGELREYSFTINELFIDATGNPVEDLYFRVLMLDEFGNWIVADQDEDLGVKRVSDFEIGQRPDTVGNQNLNTFRNNPGCFQGSDANSFNTPCIRKDPQTGPFEPIEFPIEISNGGNVADQAHVVWEHRGGDTGWTVELVNDQSGQSASKHLIVDLPEPQSLDQPSTRDVVLRITPDANANANEFKSVNVTVWSDGSASPSNPHRNHYFRAELFPISRGFMTVGENETLEERVGVRADEILNVPIGIGNDGNIRATFRPVVDQTETDTVAAGPLCVFENNLGPRDPESAIVLRLETENGFPVSDEGEVLRPGEEKALSLRAQVGREITDTTASECAFDIEIKPDGASDFQTFNLLSQPSILFEITGEPQLRILNLQPGTFDEFDVTGATLVETVPPTATEHVVDLWLENNGTVSLQPTLNLVRGDNHDKLRLGGEWMGLRQETTTSFEVDGAANSFTLPITDSDDPSLVQDHLSNDGTIANPTPRGDWHCLEVDDESNEPADEDPRVVCHIQLVYRIPTDAQGTPKAVSGDEVTTTFRWTDGNGVGTPAEVDVRLEFGHVGTVAVDSISRRVIGPDQTTQLGFVADLFDGQRFDLETQQIVPATVELYADPTATTPCDTFTIDSTQESLQRARFQTSLQTAIDANGPACSYASGTVTLGAAGPFAIKLSVADENGTELRMVRPLVLEATTNNADRPTRIADPVIQPTDVMNANGTQFAKLRYDDRSQPVQGVMLSRDTGDHALRSYLDCSGTGLYAASTSSNPALGTWTRVGAAAGGAAGPGGPMYDNTDNENTPLAPADEDPGYLLRSVGNQEDRRAVATGKVALYGWGDGTSLSWNAGWNPLVFHIEDLRGDNAQPGFPAMNDINPKVELKFLVNGDTDEDNEDEVSRYWWKTQDVPVRKLGGGFYTLDVFLPHQLTTSSWTFENHPDDPRNAIFEAWGLRIEVPNGQSTAGEDLKGEAFWRLEDLGLVASNQAGDLETDISPSPQTESLTEQRLTGDLDRQSFTRQHAAVRFLPGTPTFWATGPGIHDFHVYGYEESISNERDNQRIVPNDNRDNFREHTFRPKTDLGGRLVMSAGDRTGSITGGLPTLHAVDGEPGHYATVVNLPDLGRTPFPWNLQLSLTEDTTPLFTMLRGAQVTVHEERQAAMNGLPMPLCIGTPAWVDNNPPITGVFQEDDLEGDTIVDLRAIPGLSLDRGRFNMTPFLPYDQGIGTRHDVSADFLIRGKGLLSVDTSELHNTAELDVPIPISVRAAPLSTVQSVKAELYKGQELVAQTTLTLDEDNLYMGELTPIELGAHQLVIVATDVQEGVTVVEKAVDVVENAPPRITITSPVAVGGERAMQPGDAVVAQVSDRSISEGAITVFRQAGSGGGDDTADEPLVDNGTQVNLTLDPSPTENESTTLSIHVHTNDTDDNVDTDDGHLLEGQQVWVNWTTADGSQELINTTLDAQGNASASVTFDATGSQTLTVEVPGNVSEEFTVSVAQASSGGGDDDLTDDTSNAEIDCQTTSCTVRYTPDGQDGDVVRFKMVAEIGTEDTNDTGIVAVTLDGTAPTPSPSIGQPRIDGSPPTAAPTTTVALSGDSDVVSYLVSGIVSGTEVGTATVEQATGEVVLSQIGLTDSGQARIRVAATDLAGNTGSQTLDVRVDADGPTLSGANVTRDGPDVDVQVDAQDDAGVEELLLYFRKPGDDRFTTKKMTGASGTFTATVTEPGSTGTLRYYIEATDTLGNRQSLGSQSAPQSLSLGDVPPGNQQAPQVVITSPSPNARVSGTIDVTYEATDTAGEAVPIRSIRVQPNSGDTVPLQDQGGTTSLDTTQLAEGSATIIVEAFDGVSTGTGTVQVIVDNKPDVGACADQPLETGKGVEVCFQMATSSDIQKVMVELLRNGDTLDTRELDPSASGVYRTTFDFDEEGNYALKIVKEKSDGSTEETTSETFQVQSAAEAIAPLGRFITALVLGVLVMGLAAFAAFGRWN